MSTEKNINECQLPIMGKSTYILFISKKKTVFFTSWDDPRPAADADRQEDDRCAPPGCVMWGVSIAMEVSQNGWFMSCQGKSHLEMDEN